MRCLCREWKFSRDEGFIFGDGLGKSLNYDSERMGNNVLTNYEL